MKIGIDVSQIAYKGTGIGRFTQGLVESILKFDKSNDWVFFFSSLRNQLDYDLAKSIKKKNFQIYDYPFPPTLLSFLWNKLHKFKIDNFIKNLDFFITSDWTEPPSDFKKATIVHDLVYKRFPETVNDIIIKTQEKRVEYIKKESSVVFADSNSTKNDLISLMGFNKNKIVVNYPGVKIISTTADFDKNTLSKFQLKKKFILSVGKIEPRKNIQRLIDSFLNLNLKDTELVVVGEYGWGPRIKNYENVRYLGYINDEELFSLYKACLFFIYPSLWEGFGYPVVEAMGSGTPVATSNTSSLAEITQDAALLFNPYKESEIKQAIAILYRDSQLREKLKKIGTIQAKKFTWENYYKTLITALKTIE